MAAAGAAPAPDAAPSRAPEAMRGGDPASGAVRGRGRRRASPCHDSSTPGDGVGSLRGHASIGGARSRHHADVRGPAGGAAVDGGSRGAARERGEHGAEHGAESDRGGLRRAGARGDGRGMVRRRARRHRVRCDGGTSKVPPNPPGAFRVCVCVCGRGHGQHRGRGARPGTASTPGAEAGQDPGPLTFDPGLVPGGSHGGSQRCPRPVRPTPLPPIQRARASDARSRTRSARGTARSSRRCSRSGGTCSRRRRRTWCRRCSWC